MRFKLTAIVVAFAAAVTVRQSFAADETPVLTHCLVSLVDEAQVPAQEAGVMVSLKAKEGQIVKKGEVLAVVDDAIPQAEKRKATAERNAAKEKADSDVDIRYAAAAADVAKYEYLKNKEAYDTVKNAVPWVEVKRLELAWQRALLQIEQSNVERRINKLTVETKAAEMDAAEEGIRHRQIKSPLDGIVVQVTPHEGEWVKPGDTIMRIVRMDRLRVEGFLNSSKFAPQDIHDRKVIVTVAVAHNPQPEQFSGHVVFVSPLVEAGGDYRVWAEVDNRLVTSSNAHWVLRPGETVSMSIDTKETLAAK
jgi:multidrug efflux pump subunit AcrA (membrane-fusion protein)